MNAKKNKLTKRYPTANMDLDNISLFDINLELAGEKGEYIWTVVGKQNDRVN